MLFVPGRLPLLVIRFELLFRLQENWAGDIKFCCTQKRSIKSSEQMSKKNKPHIWRSISSFFNPLIQPTFTRDVANENPQNQFSQILPMKIISWATSSRQCMQRNYWILFVTSAKHFSQCVQWQTSGSVRPSCTGGSARNFLELQRSPKAQKL